MTTTSISAFFINIYSTYHNNLIEKLNTILRNKNILILYNLWKDWVWLNEVFIMKTDPLKNDRVKSQILKRCKEQRVNGPDRKPNIGNSCGWKINAEKSECIDWLIWGKHILKSYHHCYLYHYHCFHQNSPSFSQLGPGFLYPLKSLLELPKVDEMWLYATTWLNTHSGRDFVKLEPSPD